MKNLLRNTVFNAISLYILSQIINGVKVSGGIEVLLISGLILSLLYIFIKPILNLFSLPLNMVTLGLFSFFSNAILLYVLTVLVPDVRISQFTFNGYSFAGFVIPVMHFNTLYAYVISAGALSIIINFFNWLTKK
jgi:putative membrane protein